jgi:hypothetical protein
MCEQFNGWTNRETWAVALHVDNDQGLQEQAQEYAKHALKYCDSDPLMCLEESLENFVTELLEADWEGVKLMRYDIGSLWRVNWREIAENYLLEANEEANA